MIILINGCAVPEKRTPTGDVVLTDEYARKASGSRNPKGAAPVNWWTTYKDQELSTLIDEALTNAPDLNQTRQRILQASANTRREFSELIPHLDISGSRQNIRGKDNTTPSTFSLRGAASYELDVWRSNYAAYQAKDLEAVATMEDLKAAAITLSASIIETWLRLCAQREEEDLLREQITTNQMILDLQHLRYANGVASILDVLQQRQILARSNAQLPDLLADQERALHQLSILAGRNPSAPLEINKRRLPEDPPLPDPGIPAHLLQERPDIIAAWLRIRAADWAVASAWTERLPKFNISATNISTSTSLNTLLNTWLLRLVADIAMPIIDGGQRRAEQMRQQALADERFQAYKQTILKAIAEVEDALSQEHHQTQKITAVIEQIEASKDALGQAQISYVNGDETYLSVLNGLTSVQTLERQLIRERRDLALNRSALYRALGGQGFADPLNLESHGQ